MIFCTPEELTKMYLSVVSFMSCFVRIGCFVGGGGLNRYIPYVLLRAAVVGEFFES